MVTIALDRLRIVLAGRPVLDDITATLGGGTLVGVIGPNGAGKSTLARAILGLLPVAGGAVTIDGATLPRAELARRVAYLPQGQTVHWPVSVERLVALGRLPHLGPLSRIGAADRAAIARAMTLADVASLRNRTVTELSGGERARALLARALAVEAPALIADEPLAALDPGHQLEVMALLRRQADAGALVVAILHDLTMAARFCDRLLLLDRGRLVVDGSAESVLTEQRLADIYGVRAWFGHSGAHRLIVPVDLAAGPA